MKPVAANATSSQSGTDRLFVVIGAQRTGTNILREILNTNEQIAMLGEILSPSPAPAHWDNFCRGLPTGGVLPATCSDAESLLDSYFGFVRYRIRNHWEGNTKCHSQIFGVDIKYNQLGFIALGDWDPSSAPFILCYLRSRGATIVHTTRNIIHCAISALIADQRNLWHNYAGAAIDRKYHIDVERCLGYAKALLRARAAFLNAAGGCAIVNCRYESLVDDLKRADADGRISEGPGPLQNIAESLGAPFDFRYDGRLQKAIDVPYSSLLSNHDALIGRLKNSEFSAFVSTLE
jgi:LPS sulfotransferase NodH